MTETRSLTTEPIYAEKGVRYFKMIAAANACYAEKLVIFAMPDQTDECPKVLGSIVVSVDPVFEPIEWIEVTHDHRRKGIGKVLWRLAEQELGRKLVHAPVTKEGKKFAAALLKRNIGQEGRP